MITIIFVGGPKDGEKLMWSGSAPTIYEVPFIAASRNGFLHDVMIEPKVISYKLHADGKYHADLATWQCDHCNLEIKGVLRGTPPEQCPNGCAMSWSQVKEDSLTTSLQHVCREATEKRLAEFGLFRSDPKAAAALTDAELASVGLVRKDGAWPVDPFEMIRRLDRMSVDLEHGQTSQVNRDIAELKGAIVDRITKLQAATFGFKVADNKADRDGDIVDPKGMTTPSYKFGPISGNELRTARNREQLLGATRVVEATPLPNHELFSWGGTCRMCGADYNRDKFERCFQDASLVGVFCVNGHLDFVEIKQLFAKTVMAFRNVASFTPAEFEKVGDLIGWPKPWIHTVARWEIVNKTDKEVALGFKITDSAQVCRHRQTEPAQPDGIVHLLAPFLRTKCGKHLRDISNVSEGSCTRERAQVTCKECLTKDEQEADKILHGDPSAPEPKGVIQAGTEPMVCGIMSTWQAEAAEVVPVDFDSPIDQTALITDSIADKIADEKTKAFCQEPAKQETWRDRALREPLL